jgi:S1-C subfamily serine protease
MKKFIALAAGLFFTTLSPVHAWDVPAMNAQIDATNFIVNRGCSGTLISLEYRLILTAHHCIDSKIRKVKRDRVGDDGVVTRVEFEKLGRVKVEQSDYANYEQVGSVSYETVIFARRKERDLALLQLVGDNIRSTIVAPILGVGEKIQRGEPITAVGNPLGFDATVTTGVVSSTNRMFEVPWANSERVPLIQLSANINGGNSGGALYDSVGRQIGVVIAGVRGTDLGFAVPIFELYPTLDEICMASVYDADADDAACRAEVEAAEKKAEDE